MRRKPMFTALAASVAVTGALAAPAVAGEDELRTYDVIDPGANDFAVLSDQGDVRDRGPRVAFRVQYDCQNGDELSNQDQDFATANVARQGSESNPTANTVNSNDPSAEGTGFKRANCDGDLADEVVIVIAQKNAGSADFDNDQQLFVEGVGITFLSAGSELTDIDDDADGENGGGTGTELEDGIE